MGEGGILGGFFFFFLQKAFHATVCVLSRGMLRSPHDFSGLSCKMGVEILKLHLLCLIFQVSVWQCDSAEQHWNQILARPR